MNSEAKRRLRHALDACEAIERYTRQKTFADYLADDMLRAAVERRFEIVGTAVESSTELNDTYLKQGFLQFVLR